MATAQTLSNFDAMMKEYYTDDRVENMIYADNPFLALVPKDENFPGREVPVPLVFANPQGRSATFSTAQTAGSTANKGSQSVAFKLTRVKDFGFVTIDRELIEASESDDGAFLEATTVEVDGIINSLTRSLAISLFRKGWGKIGTIGAISGSTVTLNPITDAHNFEYGMAIQLAATEDSGALESGGPLTVVGVNRSTGLITFNAGVVATISTAAVGDSIFCDGDRDNASTPARLKVAGLEDWAPATAPTSGDSFFSVNRSVDSRLYGTSYNGASDNIGDALIQGANRAAALGYKLDHYFVSFAKYAELEQDLQTQVRYVDLKGPAEIAFRGIVLNGPRGPIKVIADQNCPYNRAFGMQMDKLKLRTLKKAIRPIASDGLDMLRLASADGVEIRYGFTGNLQCSAPASLVNVQL